MNKAQREKRKPRAFFMQSANATLEVGGYHFLRLNGSEINDMIKESIQKHPESAYTEEIPVRVVIAIEELMADEEYASGHKFEEPEEEQPEENDQETEEE